MTFRKRHAGRIQSGIRNNRRKREEQGGFLLVTFLQSGLCIFMITAAFFMSGILGMTEIKTAYRELATNETDAIEVFSSAKKAAESEDVSRFFGVVELILKQIIPGVYSNSIEAVFDIDGTEHSAAEKSPDRLDISPIKLPLQGVITSPFGLRENPVTGKEDWHTGIDIAAAEGTPIAVAWSGKVCEVGSDRIYGNFITVDHGEFKTRYCHCRSIISKEGTKLEQGEIIALSGSTGMVTGPHLHFELIVSERCTDPMAVQSVWSDLEAI